MNECINECANERVQPIMHCKPWVTSFSLTHSTLARNNSITSDVAASAWSHGRMVTLHCASVACCSQVIGQKNYIFTGISCLSISDIFCSAIDSIRKSLLTSRKCLEPAAEAISCFSVCSNTQISGIIEARDSKFCMQLSIYHTQLKPI